MQHVNEFTSDRIIPGAVVEIQANGLLVRLPEGFWRNDDRREWRLRSVIALVDTALSRYAEQHAP